VPHIELIRVALAHIERYQPADEETFLASQMVQDAILMRLQEISENLARMRQIKEEAFAAAGNGSCVQLIGLRNVISHGYHHIRPERIRNILTEELPAFATAIEAFVDPS
jgi:uncharacterized protein with HEPN domain